VTNREQQTYEAIKKAGKNGIGFEDLKAKLSVGGNSTLRQRIGSLVKQGKVQSKRNGRGATYVAN
jgi:predicted transcriptional regulator